MLIQSQSSVHSDAWILYGNLTEEVRDLRPRPSIILGVDPGCTYFQFYLQINLIKANLVNYFGEYNVILDYETNRKKTLKM